MRLSSVLKSADNLPPFLRFAIVGCIGFLIDSCILYAGLRAELDPFLARIPSFGAAVLTTYVMNRIFTFSGEERPILRLSEFYKYLIASLGGLTINWAVYVTLILYASFSPLAALVVATLTAMLFNFTLYRYFVFRSPG